MKPFFKAKSGSTLLLAIAIVILAFVGCTAREEISKSSAVTSTAESAIDSVADESYKAYDEESETDDVFKEESSSSRVEDSNENSIVESSSLEPEVESVPEKFVMDELESIEPEIGICYGKALEDITLTLVLSNSRELNYKFSKDSYFYVYNITDSAIYINYAGYAIPVSKEKIEILPEDFVQDFDTQFWEF